MAFNKLTDAEAERLACLAEECGEVIQIIGKILRHGYESHHPDSGDTNRELLEKECGDVRHWMIEMCATGDLRKERVHDWADMKALSVDRYLHHQNRWIDWKGAMACPVDKDEIVQVTYKNGMTSRYFKAGAFGWAWIGEDYDIVKYRRRR